jgi:MFS family permease
MGQAGIFPCCVNTIAKWFPPAQRALPSGLLGSFMSWGQVVASALAGFALGFMSWQTLLLLFALPGVLWAVGFHSWFRDRPVEHPAVNGAELRLILASDSSASPTEDTGKKLNEEPSTAIQATPAEGAKHESATGPPTPADDPLSAGAVWWVVLTSIPMALICAQQFFRAAAYVFYQTWYPTFLQEAHGVTEEDSGYLAAVTIAGFALGAIVGGAAADFILARTGSRRLCRQGVAVASMSGAALCHAVAYFVGDALLAVALITLGAFASGMSGPAGYTITIDMGGRYVATVFSLMNMSGNLGGFLCPPLVTALVAAVGGDWNAALPLLVGWFLAAGLAWLFINPNGSIFDRHSNNKASGAA